jgi:hypothetical protein
MSCEKRDIRNFCTSFRHGLDTAALKPSSCRAVHKNSRPGQQQHCTGARKQDSTPSRKKGRRGDATARRKMFQREPEFRDSGRLAGRGDGFRALPALRALHLVGGRALYLGWRNLVAAVRARRGVRRSHFFEIDLPAGGHRGILQVSLLMPMRVPNPISAAASSALMMRDARLEFKTRELRSLQHGATAQRHRLCDAAGSAGRTTGRDPRGSRSQVRTGSQPAATSPPADSVFDVCTLFNRSYNDLAG